MYAWGGDVSDWRGKGKYDYGSARAKYDKMAADAGLTGSRPFRTSREPDMGIVDPKGKNIASESEDPIFIGVDVTGSMQSWPGEIFDRLPLLYQTLAKHRPGLELAFGAIGDATCDSYPLQIANFSKDISELEKTLKGIGAEGGGGSHVTESYELFGYFMVNHCTTPKATSPFLLIYGDEHFYDRVDPKQVRHYVGDRLQDPLDSTRIWKDLMQKFEVYFMHKPYGRGGDSDVDRTVVDVWEKALGRQRIIELPSEDRAVDMAIALISKHWGFYDDFSKSFDARHDDPAMKKSIAHSLRFVDADPSPKSVISKPAVSKKTKGLL